jgi:hypothetical protein
LSIHSISLGKLLDKSHDIILKFIMSFIYSIDLGLKTFIARHRLLVNPCNASIDNGTRSNMGERLIENTVLNSEELEAFEQIDLK